MSLFRLFFTKKCHFAAVIITIFSSMASFADEKYTLSDRDYMRDIVFNRSGELEISRSNFSVNIKGIADEEIQTAVGYFVVMARNFGSASIDLDTPRPTRNSGKIQKIYLISVNSEGQFTWQSRNYITPELSVPASLKMHAEDLNKLKTGCLIGVFNDTIKNQKYNYLYAINLSLLAENQGLCFISFMGKILGLHGQFPHPGHKGSRVKLIDLDFGIIRFLQNSNVHSGMSIQQVMAELDNWERAGNRLVSPEFQNRFVADTRAYFAQVNAKATSRSSRGARPSISTPNNQRQRSTIPSESPEMRPELRREQNTRCRFC